MQSLDVAGDGLDLAVGHARCQDLHHLDGIFVMPHTTGKPVQLVLDVQRMLTAQCGIAGRRVTGTVGAVATHAGRHTAFGVAAAIEFLAQFNQFRVGLSDGGLLACIECSQILPIPVRQPRRHALHGVVIALAMLEKSELLDEVVFVLAGEFRPLGIDAVAIGTVACSTTGGLALSVLGITDRMHRDHGGRNQNT